MELGSKLRQARVDAGLSQRQLCGDVITRNMLSQIEHGTARPSMDTLRYLAGKLGKPVSFFLDEDVVLSPNQVLMASARGHYEAGEVKEAWLLLQSFQLPDPVLEWQWQYLACVTALDLARQAMADGKMRYARQLLEEEKWEIPELSRQRLLLLGQIREVNLPDAVKLLPSLDEELMLRAKAALEEGKPERAEHLLLAVEEQDYPEWNLRMGQTMVMVKQYAQAAVYLGKAEEAFPADSFPLLEICFRELGDFQKAYTYACKQR